MAVYQTQRFGNFSYVMPSLTPGDTYLVRLHFAETFFTLPGQRLGNVAINGTTVLADFDIALAAGAVNKALVEEFAAVADGSGNITIAFTTVTNFPAINAVEILRSVPSVGTTRFLYDPNGSLLSATTPDGSVTTYLWDAANRLQSVAMPSGYMATQIYRWDDLRVNQQSSSGLETWTWDGQNVLAWSGPSEAASSLMVMGPNLVRAVGVDTDGSPLDRQFHLDHQGSVQALTTSSQSIEADYETDAWGNEQTANTSTNRSVYLGGLGYWQEPSLGLNYVRARWMDPITGRWLSVDSVPTEPRYLYARNSPTMRIDPTGTQGDFLQKVGQTVEGLSGQIKNWWDHQGDPSPRYQGDSARFGRLNPLNALPGVRNAARKIVDEVFVPFQMALNAPDQLLTLFDNWGEPYWRYDVEAVAEIVKDLGWEDQLTRLPQFVRLPLGGSKANVESAKKSVHGWLGSLAAYEPPYVLSGDYLAWAGGYIRGIMVGAEHQILGFLMTEAQLASQIMGVIKYLIEHHNTEFWQDFHKILTEFFSPLLTLFQNHPDFKPYDYGRTIGLAKAFIVGAAIGLADGFENLLNLLKKGKSLYRFLWESRKAAAEGGGGRARHIAAILAAIAKALKDKSATHDGTTAHEPPASEDPPDQNQVHAEELDKANDHRFLPKEKVIVDWLRQHGRRVWKNLDEGVPGMGRQGDTFVDGVKTELKTVENANPNDQRVMTILGSAKGQAPHVIIDARGTTLSRGNAQHGTRRFFLSGFNPYESVSFLFDDDIFITYRPGDAEFRRY